MEILIVLLILALIFGGGFVLRLIGLAIGIVITVVAIGVVIVLVTAFGLIF